MADYESVACVKSEVFVYRIPARTSNRGYRAAEWKLDQPDWTGRLKVISKGKKLFIRLEDKISGELFAQCPVDSYPTAAIEQVLDSSRYFVIRIQDENNRSAFIGLGFADRGDSFDLLVSIQDHFKYVKREETVNSTAAPTFDPGPKLDLGFKEGQTIKLNLATKKAEPGSGKPRPKPGSSGVLLPPPPSGSRVPAPTKQLPDVSLYQTPAEPAAHIASANPGQKSNTDLLLDLDLSHTTPPAPSTDVLWNDFTSAGQKNTTTRPDPNAASWVNFE